MVLVYISLLYYNRTQEEVAHTCRGTINLAGACIDTIDSTHFLVTNGTSQVGVVVTIVTALVEL